MTKRQLIQEQLIEALYKRAELVADYILEADNSELKKLYESIGSKKVIIDLIDIALIIAAIIGIKKAYRRYFSKYASQCRGLSWSSRTKCIREAKIKAMNQQISELKIQLVKCSQTKDPEKCKRKVNLEISKITFKRNKLIK